MNVNDLKAGFDRVEIVHFNSEKYKGTHVALVKGDRVYVGISKCHAVDQFNRKRGREIAIGRAMHSWKVDAGIEPSRMSTRAAIIADCEEKMNKIVDEIHQEPSPSVELVEQLVRKEEVVESAGGCCGGCK